jgi:hypothetical protein
MPRQSPHSKHRRVPPFGAMQDRHLGVVPGELVRQLAGTVRRIVVDNEKINPFRQSQHPLDERGNVLPFIKRGNND